MSSSFSKTKHVSLASKCKVTWRNQGSETAVALAYCCWFLAFLVCTLKCVRWMGVKQHCSGTGEGKQQLLPGVRVLLKEMSLFSIACTLTELWVLASALFLCMTPRNSLCCHLIQQRDVQSVCCSCAWFQVKCKKQVGLPWVRNYFLFFGLIQGRSKCADV